MRRGYDGENRITRVVSAAYGMPIASAGIGIGAGSFTAVFFTFSPLAVTMWGNSVSFSTTPISNAAELAALYDTVRIDKVEVTFSFKGNSTNQTFTAVSAPRAWCAVDYTDGTTGNSLAITQEMGSCRMLQLSEDQGLQTITVRPMYQRVVYQTPVTSAYEPSRGFMSTNADVPHYGLRLALDPTLLGTGLLTCSFKYFFTLKNVK